MYRLIWKCCRSATIADKFGRCITTQSGGVDVSAEVESALHCGKAVVALESTIVTHGMPYPHNLTTALEVEEICRRGGVVPATIAVIKGRLHVGMDRSQIEQLADPQTNKVKISRRDLPSALSQGLTGGTTTAGTMVAAHLSGIQIFATGGIGGVHRDGHITMDVSSDLKELGRTPITVVSAGVKSILDIGRTLEYLETEGVCVVAYNQTTDFPSFFSPTSGHSAPHCVRNAQEAANLIAARNALGLSSGILIGVPIPHQDAPDGRIIQDAIHIATIEAKEKGIMGKDLTPFVLERVNQITEGASLRANIELIRNNAKVASEISLALSRTKNAQQLSNDDKTADPLTVGKPSQRTRSSSHQQDRPVVIGGTNVDVIVTPHEKMKVGAIRVGAKWSVTSNYYDRQKAITWPNP